MAINWRNEPDPKLVLKPLDEVVRLSGRFKPVIRRDQDEFVLRTSTEPTYDSMFLTSYSWSDREDDQEVEFLESNCEWMAVKCGYYGMFKPSVAEIVSQIPEKYITDPFYQPLNAFYAHPDTVQIYRSGSYQLVLVYLGITRPLTPT